MNRSDSFVMSSEEEVRAESQPQFLNHDVLAEVALFVGVFGGASSCFALVSRRWYQALVSVFDEWREYQGGFGLPRSVLISESSNYSTFNYRAAVVESLKQAAKGDRGRVLMEPEQYVDDDSANRTALVLPAGTQKRITLARTGHLRSKRYSYLWGPVIRFLSKRVKVAYLSVLPVAWNSPSSIGSYFLYGCSSLSSVDLSGLSSVTAIGHNFLTRCSSLTTVDVAGLSSVTTTGDGFLHGCSSLTSVKQPEQGGSSFPQVSR